MSEYYPPVSFYFDVRVANTSYSFSEVSGLTAEMKTKPITEGGENRFSHRVPTRMEYGNLTLKRGLQIDKSSKLVKWCVDTLSFGGGNAKKKIAPKSVFVGLLDEEGKVSAGWDFINAYPIKWKVADLNSTTGNQVLIEEIELSYQYFTRTK